MASWTPWTVVWRSATICEIDTFITLLSRTMMNWAAARIAIGPQLALAAEPAASGSDGWASLCPVVIG